MKSTKRGRKANYPRVAEFEGQTVTMYRRKMANGKFGFMVASYATGRRVLRSFADEDEGWAEAKRLAEQMSKDRVVAGLMPTQENAIEFAGGRQRLAHTGVTVLAACGTISEALKHVGIADVVAACRLYAQRHTLATAKPVAETVKELIALKESRGASKRYLEDLRSRLGQFAKSFKKDACNVSTADLQAWLDGKKRAPQSYTNLRRILHLWGEFCETRSYCAENPAAGLEVVPVRGGEIETFKPEEIARLLAAAPAEFLPSLAIGAFAGLRSAEIERLDWDAVDLTAKQIVLDMATSKTASRRIVPISENLLAWLAPYAGSQGKIWKGGHDEFYELQQQTAAATEVIADAEKGIKALKPVKWKANALRHSYASYRFKQIGGDAGRVAGELGNSAAVVHKHYKTLLTAADAAAKWFSIRPEAAVNVVPMSAEGR